MNTKYFLSACLFSLLSCQNDTPPALDESCPADELPVLVKTQPTSLAATIEPASAKVEITAAPAIQEKPTMAEGELRLVSSFGERQFLMLQSIDQASLAKGKSKLISKKGQHAVRRDVDLTHLPASTLAWVGQEVSLLQRDNTFCEAKVSGLALLGQMYVYNDETLKKSAAELFTQMQERGGVRLVAELEANNCKDVRFARLSSLTTPEVLTPKAADKELRKLVLPLMRVLPTYKEIQKRYTEYQEHTPTDNKRWENHYGAKPVISMISTSTETLVYASVQHDNGCGDFYGNLFALWRLNDDDSLTLLYQGDSDVNPDAALDLDQDGTLEFLQGNQWRSMQDGSYQNKYDFYIADEEDVCSC